jgi:hypothetical protein
MIRALTGHNCFGALLSCSNVILCGWQGESVETGARHEQFGQLQPKPEESVYRAKLKNSTCVIGRGHPQRMCLQPVTAMAMGHANRTVRIDML